MLRKVILSLAAVLSLVSFTWANYATEVAADNPIMWLRFDDYRYNNDRTATDITGNVDQATYQGDTVIVAAGIDGTAGLFNGYISAVDLASQLGPMLNGVDAITFEAWVRNSYLQSGTSQQRIFATRISGGLAGMDVGIGSYTDTTGYVRIAGRSSTADSYSSANVNFNYEDQWSHLVCIMNYAQNQIETYINGQLAGSTAMSFSSSTYTYAGSPTQTDHVGLAPDGNNPYRGHLDEVAVYDYALSAARINAHYLNGNPQEPDPLWTSLVAGEGAFEGPFLSSPSIYRFEGGIILASYSYFGDNRPVSGTSVIKISYNNGASWASRSLLPDVSGATMFENNGTLYSIGTGGNAITIAKSTNFALTWTAAVDLCTAGTDTNLSFEGISMPMLFANGRIYRVFHRKDKTQNWPVSFAVVMISADQNDNLLDPASWTVSNAVPFDPAWASAWGTNNPGWLEGNAVQAPDGQIVVVTRVHSDPEVDIAAILPLSADNTTLTFDPATGFIDLPGGRNKFNIHRDPVTGKYLALANNNTDPSRAAQRNVLSLIASDDLVNWTHIRTLVSDDSPMTWGDSLLNIGFQYVDWQFVGDDIIYLSRTAYDGAHNYHDSNKITFHRLENYLNLITACGEWGYSTMDFNQDCVVDLMDLAEFSKDWLVCTLPHVDGCVMR